MTAAYRVWKYFHTRPLPEAAQATECVFRRSDLSPTVIALDAGRDPKDAPLPPAIAGGRTNYL